ncbi:hypothetical protein [Streptomyces wuyuanensis]|uniref:hypothetical protein n=1 Tax=Streptomyces wuyuanensis TaxID=1196353 RepID=UPI003D70A814
MARSSINQRAIEKHLKEIAKGYERAARRNPIRLPLKLRQPQNHRSLDRPKLRDARPAGQRCA